MTAEVFAFVPLSTPICLRALRLVCNSSVEVCNLFAAVFEAMERAHVKRHTAPRQAGHDGIQVFAELLEVEHDDSFDDAYCT